MSFLVIFMGIIRLGLLALGAMTKLLGRMMNAPFHSLYATMPNLFGHSRSLLSSKHKKTDLPNDKSVQVYKLCLRSPVRFRNHFDGNGALVDDEHHAIFERQLQSLSNSKQRLMLAAVMRFLVRHVLIEVTHKVSLGSHGQQIASSLNILTNDIDSLVKTVRIKFAIKLFLNGAVQLRVELEQSRKIHAA
nr:MAG TPA: hypothetical protein [Caudoviricetes sp.]